MISEDANDTAAAIHVVRSCSEEQMGGCHALLTGLARVCLLEQYV